MRDSLNWNSSCPFLLELIMDRVVLREDGEQLQISLEKYEANSNSFQKKFLVFIGGHEFYSPEVIFVYSHA